MNRKIKTAIAASIAGIFIFTGYSACIKDNCTDVLCQNGGVCVDATCACANGYEGVNCEVRWHDKFSGRWLLSEKYIGDTGTKSYNVEIAGTVPDSFVMYGLAERANVVFAQSANRKFNLPAEQVTDTFLTIKTGTGTLNDDGSVTGLYSFLQRTIINDTTVRDTIITSKFTLTR